MIGQTINSYRIMEQVAAGGFGTLYRAEHLFLNRVVAFKVLHPHHTNEARFLSKFRSEGQFLAQLQHPNIVKVHDAGQDSGYYWLAMEWLDGKEVKEVIQTQKQLPISLAVSIAEQVASALEYAHAKNLIHRDIKPANLMLLPGHKVIVLDFGIATMVEVGGHASTEAGTYNYMPYEQLSGQADHRSDLYALGVTLYEMLTGELPPRFALAPPTPPRQFNAAIPERLEQFLYRTLAQDPNQRPQSATAFRKELLQAAAQPAKATPPRKSNPTVVLPPHVVNRTAPNATPQPLNFGFNPVNVSEFTHLQRTNNFEPRFTWSPDGRALAFTGPMNDPAAANLYLLDFNTLQTRLDIAAKQKQIDLQAIAQHLKGATRPVWSPDGQQVIFVSTDDKIWGVSKSGRIKPITLDHTVDNPRWWSNRLAGYVFDKQMLPPSYKSAAWSPNREFLAVLKEDNVSIYNRSGSKIVDVNDFLRSSYYQQLPYYQKRHMVPKGPIAWLDNQRIVVGNIFETDHFFWDLRLSIIDIKSKKVKEFTCYSEFSISHDKNWIAAPYLFRRDQRAIMLINTSNYQTHDINFHPKSHAVTVWAWSPKSAKLLLTIGETIDGTNLIWPRESSTIWAVNTNDTGLQQLAQGYAPHWSPDGRHIAFLHSPQEQVYDLWVMEVEPGRS